MRAVEKRVVGEFNSKCVTWNKSKEECYSEERFAPGSFDPSGERAASRAACTCLVRFLNAEREPSGRSPSTQQLSPHKTIVPRGTLCLVLLRDYLSRAAKGSGRVSAFGTQALKERSCFIVRGGEILAALGGTRPVEVLGPDFVSSG